MIYYIVPGTHVTWKEGMHLNTYLTLKKKLSRGCSSFYMRAFYKFSFPLSHVLIPYVVLNVTDEPVVQCHAAETYK